MLVILLLISISVSGLGVMVFCAACCLGAQADCIEIGHAVLLDADRRIHTQAPPVPVVHQLMAVAR
ncbi:MAG: hypothetical protein M3220_11305 [Chloroflexota bacterium]|nr:hypothetical protein [Chloroflexota bacterium]